MLKKPFLHINEETLALSHLSISLSHDTLFSALLNIKNSKQNIDAKSSLSSNSIAAQDYVSFHTCRISLSRDTLISALLNINNQSRAKH